MDGNRHDRMSDFADNVFWPPITGPRQRPPSVAVSERSGAASGIPATALASERSVPREPSLSPRAVTLPWPHRLAIEATSQEQRAPHEVEVRVVELIEIERWWGAGPQLDEPEARGSPRVALPGVAAREIGRRCHRLAFHGKPGRWLVSARRVPFDRDSRVPRPLRRIQSKLTSTPAASRPSTLGGRCTVPRSRR